jgi:hypothetical protein
MQWTKIKECIGAPWINKVNFSTNMALWSPFHYYLSYAHFSPSGHAGAFAFYCFLSTMGWGNYFSLFPTRVYRWNEAACDKNNLQSDRAASASSSNWAAAYIIEPAEWLNNSCAKRNAAWFVFQCATSALLGKGIRTYYRVMSSSVVVVDRCIGHYAIRQLDGRGQVHWLNQKTILRWWWLWPAANTDHDDDEK